MKTTQRSLFALLAVVPFAILGVADAQKPEPVTLVSTMARVPYTKIEPLIKAKCEPCHNSKRHPEKVDLSSYEALMSSGEHGTIVVPFRPLMSKLVLYCDGSKEPRMPFKKAPLKDDEIRLLKGWIARGATK